MTNTNLKHWKDLNPTHRLAACRVCIDGYAVIESNTGKELGFIREIGRCNWQALVYGQDFTYYNTDVEAFNAVIENSGK